MRSDMCEHDDGETKRKSKCYTHPTKTNGFCFYHVSCMTTLGESIEWFRCFEFDCECFSCVELCVWCWCLFWPCFCRLVISINKKSPVWGIVIVIFGILSGFIVLSLIVNVFCVGGEVLVYCFGVVFVVW